MAILTNLKLVEKKISKVIDSDEPLFNKNVNCFKNGWREYFKNQNENFRDIKNIFLNYGKRLKI